MASESEFAAVPPWPSTIPTLQLPRISLSKLRSRDTEEEAAVFKSCRQLGFFQLDLSSDETGAQLMSLIAQTLDIARTFYAQPDAAKTAYAVAPPGRILGYKKIGFTTLAEGVRDRCEVFSLGQSELTSPEPFIPEPMKANLDVFREFVGHAHDILQLICRVLDAGFELPEGTFWAKHQPDKESFSMFRLNRFPPIESEAQKRASMVAHTDFGSITLLVNVLGGLQVLEPGTPNTEANWRYVKPEPGCLIVNMGDAMVEWSGGVLRSNMHRVSFAPGEQGRWERFSVAYFLRPAREADMKRLKGGLVPELGEGERDVEDSAFGWEHKKTLAIIQNRNLVGSAGGNPLKGEA